jgi:hypothetical protein
MVKRGKRNRIWMSVLVASIMILSVVAFSLNLKNREEEGKTVKVRIGDKTLSVEMVYSKNETGDVEKNYKPSLEDFINRKYYFYSDPRLKDKAIRLISFLNYFTMLNEACHENMSCHNEYLPIKNCDSNFIIFEYSEKKEINKDGLCIFLRGNETSIDKVIDAFFYELKG